MTELTIAIVRHYETGLREVMTTQQHAVITATSEDEFRKHFPIEHVNGESIEFVTVRVDDGLHPSIPVAEWAP